MKVGLVQFNGVSSDAQRGRASAGDPEMFSPTTSLIVIEITTSKIYLYVSKRSACSRRADYSCLRQPTCSVGEQAEHQRFEAAERSLAVDRCKACIDEAVEMVQWAWRP